jgi:hypothetical protein
MIRVLVSLLLAALAAVGAELQASPTDSLLARFRAQLNREMEQAPQYSCLATIDRSIRQSSKNKPLAHDRMRVRMAFLGSGEVYAWPDSPKFERGTLVLLARGDAGSSSGLSGWGRIAAGLPESSFSAAGECTLDGRRGTGYDVRVPWAGSSYSATLGARQLVLPYAARFCVDPATAELIGLDLHAEQLKAPFASVSETVVYAHTRIAASEWLAPQSRELSILDEAGNLQIARTRLSDCQPYADATPAESAAAAAQAAARSLPAKLTLDMKLETPISFERSFVGDAVVARLQHPVRAAGIDVPKGTLLNGRIGRLEEQAMPERHYVVGLEFNTVAVNGAEFRFHARLTGPAISYDRRPDAMLRQDPLMAPVWDARGLDIDTTDPTSRLGVFRVRSGKLEIGPGLHMIWETLPLD